MIEVLTDRSEKVEALVALADKKKKSFERLPISEYEKYCQSMKFQNIVTAKSRPVNPYDGESSSCVQTPLGRARETLKMQERIKFVSRAQ